MGSFLCYLLVNSIIYLCIFYASPFTTSIIFLGFIRIVFFRHYFTHSKLSFGPHYLGITCHSLVLFERGNNFSNLCKCPTDYERGLGSVKPWAFVSQAIFLFNQNYLSSSVWFLKLVIFELILILSFLIWIFEV